MWLLGVDGVSSRGKQSHVPACCSIASTAFSSMEVVGGETSPEHSSNLVGKYSIVILGLWVFLIPGAGKGVLQTGLVLARVLIHLSKDTNRLPLNYVC
ncbi:hypothetical protein BRADI_5g06628v3 [Brachypodium distachyon]|uniref:Uncharacterized protein n=1 Tax=Brachypodium distachyon TaxID=15368 RepID=A0A0Q3E776_BRADI|nr:hypothetical protein BRADI_5g06628v3 [Brachypodium distachyon]